MLSDFSNRLSQKVVSFVVFVPVSVSFFCVSCYDSNQMILFYLDWRVKLVFWSFGWIFSLRWHLRWLQTWEIWKQVEIVFKVLRKIRFLSYPMLRHSNESRFIKNLRFKIASWTGKWRKGRFCGPFITKTLKFQFFLCFLVLTMMIQTRHLSC